jgi:hypothetical protein
MKSLLSLACLLACSFAHAATIELPNPTARQVLNVQCGYPSPIPIAAGFSQPGDYVKAVFSGTDSCSLGGRAHMVKRYYGCAVVRWDLSGLMIDVVQFPANPDHSCTVPPNTLYPAPQGYAANIAANEWNVVHVFLETP